MHRTKLAVIGKLGFGLCFALPGFTTYGQPSVSVGVSVGLPAVQIRAESDFYEPLTPYGRWEVVGSYGRCWIPGRVEAAWRPYCNGYWQRTDVGWYWQSDEPWGWATYHYGRWDLSAQWGWYWVPQTQWAPAWVSWHRGGGYVGWAPLYPSGVSVISPRAYVFVEERHFLEPVRPTTVVVNKTTIINKTTVIKAGPATGVIEKASGRKVQAVAVRDLRSKDEARVVARQRSTTPTVEKNAQAPVTSVAALRETKAVPAQKPRPIEQPAVMAHAAVAPPPQKQQVEHARVQPVTTPVEAKPVVLHETKPVLEHEAKPVANKVQEKKTEQPQPPPDKAGPPGEKDKGHDNSQ